MGSNIAVMYVWTANRDSWGHASLSLNDAYISSWPTGDKSKNSMKGPKSEGKTKECVPDDYEDDRDNFTGREYTHRFYIWISAKGVEKNTEMALREGGIEIAMYFIGTPGGMVELGKELENKTSDEELNKDVKRWKKIRYETLLRMNYLKQELYRANEKIKNSRILRNITTGASLFVGALFAPFTGGASLVGAAAVTTGVAGITFIIETIIEGNVIGTTQAAVDKDKTETIRLRQKVTYFQGIVCSPFAVELFKVSLGTICNLREQSLLSFIKSWTGTDSTSLLNAIAKLEKYTRNLESELNTAEKVQEKYAML
ncbi:unnamed protein product [Mytilus edulis]|uniref:Uncharacterized protein n=1 Tax=Mytilus edulis TaxID=6550 RepID=A0A8S3UYW5_MYTED|nr:unnamed protein product [Mytilus edulis]